MQIAGDSEENLVDGGLFDEPVDFRPGPPAPKRHLIQRKEVSEDRTPRSTCIMYTVHAHRSRFLALWAGFYFIVIVEFCLLLCYEQPHAPLDIVLVGHHSLWGHEVGF